MGSEKSYRMDEHVDPPFEVGPRALEIYRERLEIKDGVHGQYENAVLQVAHYAFNEGLSALRKLVEAQGKALIKYGSHQSCAQYSRIDGKWNQKCTCGFREALLALKETEEKSQ